MQATKETTKNCRVAATAITTITTITLKIFNNVKEKYLA